MINNNFPTNTGVQHKNNTTPPTSSLGPTQSSSQNALTTTARPLARQKPIVDSFEAKKLTANAVEKKLLTPKQEKAFLQKVFNEATKTVKTKYPTMGRGWLGNVTRSGPECDKVHQAYENEVEKLIKKEGVKLRHFHPATLFSSGALPWDLTAHVYMGIVDKNKKPVTVFDPWRNGSTKPIAPSQNPNRVDKVIPW